MMAYTLTLTAEDWQTIRFVGGRYAWADALLGLTPEDEDTTTRFTLPEVMAWALVEAFDADTEGGHGMFPLLDPRSALYDKLTRFRGSIV